MQTFNIVDPARDDETYEAFADLLPGNTDYRAENYLLFGAIDEDATAVATMAVEITDFGYSINWIYVDPEARRQGAASFLFDTFLKFVDESMTFSEIEMVFSSNNLSLLYFLYSREEFSFHTIGTEYLIRGSMEAGAIINRFLTTNHHATEWSETVGAWKIAFLSKMKEDGIFTPVIANWEDSLVPDLCLVKEKDQRIASAILVAKVDERLFEIQLLYSDDQESTIEVLAAACQRWRENYPNTDLTLTAVNDTSRKMVGKIFPFCEEIGVKYLVSWNYR